MAAAIRSNALPAKPLKCGPIFFAKAMTSSPRRLLWRPEGADEWRREPMTLHGNDRWHGSFTPPQPGWYAIAIEAWTDQFATWRKEFRLKQQAGQDVTLEAREGAQLARPELMPREREARLCRRSGAERVRGTRRRGRPADRRWRAAMAETATAARPDAQPGRAADRRPRTRPRRRLVRDGAAQPGQRAGQARHLRRLHRARARYRRARLRRALSHADPPDRPHQPQGQEQFAQRRARTIPAASTPSATSRAATTRSIRELGTLDDFRRLVEACRQHDMEIALDFAVQCSPDHPWLKQHPEWFSRRPDGSIKFAENPPKKYEDIVNPDFNCPDRIALWQALRDVMLFWIEQGVRIFRVDNPHTKPLPFWEWLIREVQSRHPDVLFLSEAFTRPKLMKALAKLGFSQSYTYFTWRTGKAGNSGYLTEITGYPERDYFRPNFFVTTPDILPVQLQSGEPWLFKARAALAATLSSNYGIYNGFELIEHEPIPGREEYLDSEKYEIKTRDWNKPGNIKDYLRRSQPHAPRQPGAAADQRSALPAGRRRQRHRLHQGIGRRNAVAVAIALSNNLQEFWLHFGDVQIGPAGRAPPVRAIENLVTGERHLLEWNGRRLRIDPRRRSRIAVPLPRVRHAMNIVPTLDTDSRAEGRRRPLVQGRRSSISCTSRLSRTATATASAISPA